MAATAESVAGSLARRARPARRGGPARPRRRPRRRPPSASGPQGGCGASRGASSFPRAALGGCCWPGRGRVRCGAVRCCRLGCCPPDGGPRRAEGGRIASADTHTRLRASPPQRRQREPGSKNQWGIPIPARVHGLRNEAALPALPALPRTWYYTTPLLRPSRLRGTGPSSGKGGISPRVTALGGVAMDEGYTITSTFPPSACRSFCRAVPRASTHTPRCGAAALAISIHCKPDAAEDF